MQPNEPIRCFIGYDAQESAAYHVLASSILRRATVPVAIIPLTRQSVSGVYTRQRGPREATEFSMTRFLVPYLSGYQGRSIFMDCDMVCRVDLAELWREIEAQPGKSLWCCQHNYVPKFNGSEQTKYPRKNWSSFMVFDNAKCRALTPDYVNTASEPDLHQLHWVVQRPLVCPLCKSSDGTFRKDPAWTRCKCACGKVWDAPIGVEGGDIGALPLEWNWLVGEYEPNPDAKILHYTLGTPCFPDYANCDHAYHADLWWEEFFAMTSPTPITAPGRPLRVADVLYLEHGQVVRVVDVLQETKE